MLMITVETDATTVIFRLAGRLAGPGVRELARTWSASAIERPHCRARLDLAGVTSVDALGREFLAEVHRGGDALVDGAATGALVAEVSDRVPPDTP